MIIIQFIEPGLDCPPAAVDSPAYMGAVIEATKRRLELRAQDYVIVKFGRREEFPQIMTQVMAELRLMGWR